MKKLRRNARLVPVGKNRIDGDAPRFGVGKIPALVRVMPVWERSLTEDRKFAVTAAQMAPRLLRKANESDVPKIFVMIGKTLALNLSPNDAERAAEGLMRAVLRHDHARPRDIPSSARDVIRKNHGKLRKFPDVWRTLGSFYET